MNEWFGSLPSHWRTKKINELFSERREKVSDKEYAPLSVSKGGVVPQISTVAKTSAGDNRKRVCIGDYAINSRSDRRGSSGVSQYEGSVSLINIVLSPRNEHNSRFFHYLLRSHSFIDEYYRNGRGIVADLWTTRYTEMKGIYLPLPPRPEQDQIVRYLDWKVSQVNRLINAKKKQIELLQEQKRGVIEESLYSSDYPTIRIKELFQLIDERNHSPSSEVRLLSLYSSFGVKPTDEIEKTTGNKSVTVENYKIVKSQEIIVNIILCWQGAIGLSEYDGVTSPAYDVYRAKTKDINVRYYHYLFRTKRFGDECYKVGHGIMKMRWRVYSDEFTALEVPLPSLHEQAEVVKSIEDKISGIERAIERISTEITLLHEYRTRLISDVVTGKMDVRGLAVPDFEEVDETTAADETDEFGADSTEGIDNDES